ncbi:DNA cytosine methyltransferase [Acanthopleuribacter pedis]|uniref:Cytosine-specific methyltransferase n=1 Tax=Acanthopleuribacter pedis TaxID=442870 RepID=A0A8J7U6P0_9BACT|nr:DNA cytosine methyltransferase [Acanthopleuribacter pedis]MBO1320586.1 DNA cytosine methyltransferase [Acanthopleuribacter pedis]
MMEKPKAIDAFCGPGGMSLGVGRAGFETVYAFDIDEPSVATYRRNIGSHAQVKDVCDVHLSTITAETGLAKGDLDLLTGGPPCQGFSKQKRGAHKGDRRNDLVLQFVRLVRALQPKVFLFENVAIFGQKRGRKYLSQIQRELADYQMTLAFVNSADYGVPQTRQRFIIVGVRIDVFRPFSFPKPSTPEWLTVGDVLAGLPEPPADYSHHPQFPNHQRARVTARNIQRFSHVPQGGGWQDIPYELRLKCHQKVDVKSGGWPDVYGRLRWDGQCPTITGGFDSFTRGRYGHPLYDRPLTPREAARIQGFPDSFVFQGTRGDIRSQIGNAVPPPLAEAIGREVRQTLNPVAAVQQLFAGA